MHILVDVDGQLSVKRRIWNKPTYAPAFFGTTLQFGDSLMLEGNNPSAKVLCADLQLRDVYPPNPVGVPCPDVAPVMTNNGAFINSVRGSLHFSDVTPWIISPRMTAILDGTPLLRWRPVAGATSYRVKIMDGVREHWSNPNPIKGKAEMTYPAKEAPLVPGVTYLLTVEAGNHSSDEEQGEPLGFSLLVPDEAKLVHEAAQKVRNLHLDDSRTRFLMAQLYESRSLFSEAAQQLEGITGTLKEPSVFRELGSIYGRVGLLDFARDAYRQALKLSEERNNPRDEEGRALAAAGLGEILLVGGETADAARYLQQAREWYSQVEDQDKLKELDRLLSTSR